MCHFQFEAHLRAVMGLPIPDLKFVTNDTNAIMLNVLGDLNTRKELELCQRTLEVDGGSVYLYGKAIKTKKKVRHINIVRCGFNGCL